MIRTSLDVNLAKEVALEMNKKVPLLCIAASFLVNAVPYFAHHGDAGRYEENVVVLTGSVVEVQLVDPHSIIVLDIPDEKGQMVRWQAELGDETRLQRTSDGTRTL